MKKFILACAAGAMLLGTASCGKSSAATPEAQAINDSVTVLFGKLIGAQFNTNFAADSTFDKEEFIRGIMTAVDADSTQDAFLQGVNYGARFAQQFNYFEKEYGVTVDRDEFMNVFKTALMAKTAPDVTVEETQLNGLMERAQKAAEERKLEALNNSPEAQAGLAAGKAYIDSIRKADPTVKVTDSGLAYKVVSEGAGQKVTDNDQVSVIYKGMLIDGTVFDNSNGEARTFSPRNVVPGFGEGLKLMNKGAKYIFYIPGNLAYGPQGQPYANIGANATLVFEVEVADINTPN